MSWGFSAGNAGPIDVSADRPMPATQRKIFTARNIRGPLRIFINEMLLFGRFAGGKLPDTLEALNDQPLARFRSEWRSILWCVSGEGVIACKTVNQPIF
jgi:hypothetical protein